MLNGLRDEPSSAGSFVPAPMAVQTAFWVKKVQVVNSQKANVMNRLRL
jgi:hypothetical protein